MNSEDFLFDKVYQQAAHIAILDVALKEAKSDLTKLKEQILANSAAYSGIGTEGLNAALSKIEVAYTSIERLKKGFK